MSYKIVVLDDCPLQNLVNRRKVSLHQDLCLVAWFTKIADAIAYLKNNPVDILLTDVEMPNLNGFEVMARIPPHIRVIMNSTNLGYASTAIEYGAVGFLVKPWNKSVLSQVIRHITISEVGKENRVPILMETKPLKIERIEKLPV